MLVCLKGASWKMTEQWCGLRSNFYEEVQFDRSLAMPSSCNGKMGFEEPSERYELQTGSDRNSTMPIICRLRETAKTFSAHCTACVFKLGHISNTDTALKRGGHTHGWSSFSRKCNICLGAGHNATRCPNVEKPSERRQACRWCFLQHVRGRRIHEGFGSPSNEYGSREYCPFQNLVSLAVACWGCENMRTRMCEQDVLHEKDLKVMNSKSFFHWLVDESSTAHNGILKFAMFAKALFDGFGNV